MCTKILTVLSTLLISVILAKEQPKCCNHQQYFNQSIHRINGNYECADYFGIRYQILTDDVGFLNKNKTGECVEVAEDGVVFLSKTDQRKVENSHVPEYYKKCCPVGFVYDTKTHSCAQNSSADYSFIRGRYVKIGLPKCKIINDHNNLLINDFFLKSGEVSSDNFEYSSENFCIDINENSKFTVRGCEDSFAVCSGTRCIRKCCPDGQSFVNGPNCETRHTDGIDLRFSDRIEETEGSFAIIHGYDSCKLYILRPLRYRYTLDREGTFTVYDNKTDEFLRHPVEELHYCIEYSTRSRTYEFFGCFNKHQKPVKIVISRWAKILSCICLILTISVYLLLPEMRNLFGKILISYCFCLLFALALLSYLQFLNKQADRICFISGLVALYLVQGQFYWLSIICFDVWWMLGSSRSRITIQQKVKETKRFLLYSLYGWGCPLIWTLLIYGLSQMMEISRIYRPIFGQYKCYLENRDGTYSFYIFVLAPMTILELTNTVFFIKTVLYCLKVKSEISRMKDTSAERKSTFAMDTEKMGLVLKLSIIMGTLYLFEVVSSITDFSKNSVTFYIEIAWDTLNCCQGLLIFLVFVAKKKVLQSLAEKFHLINAKAMRKTSATSTLTTQVNGTTRNSPD